MTPDLITFAEGVTSGHEPLGGVVVSAAVAATFDDRVYPGGLTYQGHPLACASAVASIEIFKDEKIIENARRLGTDVIGPELAKIADRHPSVGEVRGLGVFWAVEFVKNKATREPLVPFNATGDAAKPMNDFAAACKRAGLRPMTHFNRTHVVPPCTTTEVEVREGAAGAAPPRDPRRSPRSRRQLHRLTTSRQELADTPWASPRASISSSR